MESNKHYFLVGIFVLVTTILALIFTVWLTSSNSGDFVKYRIRFAESVSGLSVGGAVKYRGVDVGSVEAIAIDPHDTKLISVVIKIQKGTPIKTDTEASLKLQGITGVVFIELSGGSDNAPKLAQNSDSDDPPEIKAKSSPISAIVDRLPEILDKVSKAVEQINKMVSDDNVASMGGILQDTQKITQSLAEDMKQFEPLLKNANNTAADLAQMTANSKTSIAETVANLNRSSQQLDSLMRDLKKTSRNVSGLAEGLNDDPSRLIFASPQKGVPAP